MFTAYASGTGSTLRDRRLSRPGAWCEAAHRERWQKCGLPEDTRCKTNPTVALERLQAVVQAGTVRFRWVTWAEACGREPTCLDGVAAVPRWDRAAVPHETRVWLTRPATAVPAWSGRGRRPHTARLVPGAPAPPRVAQLVATLPAEAWPPALSTEGSTGPLVAECACPRGVAVRAGVPGPDVWIVLRRALGADPERTVSLSTAPAQTPIATLVRVTGRRWPIETALEESKGGLGMDHYEVRSWLGWQQHITLCLLAQHFLVRARARVKKGRRR